MKTDIESQLKILKEATHDFKKQIQSITDMHQGLIEQKNIKERTLIILEDSIKEAIKSCKENLSKEPKDEITVAKVRLEAAIEVYEELLTFFDD